MVFSLEYNKGFSYYQKKFDRSFNFFVHHRYPHNPTRNRGQVICKWHIISTLRVQIPVV